MPPAKDNFPTALPFLPSKLNIRNLQAAARQCKGCDLWERATQTVFGEGASRARVMLVGEQPGDKEDIAGHPFVGPAGKILDEALAAEGIERVDVYVTDAVEHFSWTPDGRGKRPMPNKHSKYRLGACSA